MVKYDRMRETIVDALKEIQQVRISKIILTKLQ